MKKLISLIVLALILGLVLTGCLLSNVGQVPTTEQSGITYLTKHTADAPQVIDLLAGQTEKVGEVEVWNDEDFLYVKYIITVPDWCLTETHLHVASELNLIPHTKKGNPIPGQFDYSEYYEPCVTEYTYEIELGWNPCTELYIAAHAVVVKYGTVCVDFEEYSEYDTVSTVSTLAGDVNFYMTDYSGMTDSLGLLNINVGDTAALLHTADLFPVVAEEQTKDPDHDYIDPDMQNIVGFTVGGTYEDDWVKADPDNTGAGGKLLTDPPDFTLVPFWQHAYSNFQAILMDFTQINMPKSVSFAGVDLDWNEVWYILYFDMNNTLIHIAIEGPPSGQSGDGVAFPISYSNPDIDKIVIWGNMNGGTPGKVGFAIDNICLEAVIQEETAWADGTRFVDPGNWATYFTYQLQHQIVCIDFSVLGLEPGDSVEGPNTVFSGLEIDAVSGNAVKLMPGIIPATYGAPNGSSSILNGCMSSDGGFADENRIHEYVFTFDGISVSEFSLHMLDFGDFNPDNDVNHLVNMIAYDDSDNEVDNDSLEYTSSAAGNPRTSNIYGDLYFSGDACDADPGEPGNWTWEVFGSGIVKVKLLIVEGRDPNIAFDNLCFTIECPDPE